MQRWSRKWEKSTFWHLLLLLGVAGYLASGALYGVDISLDDDARYMENGILYFYSNAFREPTPAWAAWGPLYQMWYWFLWHLRPDPIVIYYTTILSLGILLPLFLYLLLRLWLGIHPLWAFGVAWIYALSYANWWVEPRVTLFATLAFMGMWHFIGKMQEGPLQWWAFALAAAFVAYIRPEYWISFYLFAFLFAKKALHISSLRTICAQRHYCVFLVVASGGILFLTLWWGVPFQKGRLVYAFGQHYARNVTQCQFAPLIEQGVWEQYLERDFGHPTGLLSLVIANPKNFILHLGCNLKEWTLRMGKVFLFHVPFFKKGVRVYEALLLGVILLVNIVWQIKRKGKTLLKQITKDTVLIPLVWSAPSLISSFVIWPREHYLAQLVPLGWIVYSEMFLPSYNKTKKYSRWMGKFIFIIPLVFALLTPPFSNFYPYSKGRQPRLESALILRGIQWKKPPGIAGTRGSGFYRLPPYLLPQQAKPLRPKKHTETFMEFLQNTSPDVLVVSRGGVEYRWDPGWKRFLSDPARYNYLHIQLSSGDAFGPWQLFIYKSNIIDGE